MPSPSSTLEEIEPPACSSKNGISEGRLDPCFNLQEFDAQSIVVVIGYEPFDSLVPDEDVAVSIGRCHLFHCFREREFPYNHVVASLCFCDL